MREKIASEFREQCKAQRAYQLKLKKERGKRASEYLDELVKEAGVVSHASKNVKRYGQLITGSKAKQLKGTVNTLQNSKPIGIKEGVKAVKDLGKATEALNTEVGKVRKARAITGAVVGTTTAAATVGVNRNKKQGIENV